MWFDYDTGAATTDSSTTPLPGAVQFGRRCRLGLALRKHGPETSLRAGHGRFKTSIMILVARSDRSNAHWRTYRPERRVLAVVHNVTAATRLFDVMNLVAEDPRVEVIFTDPESSAFPDGTAEFLRSRGVRNLPWSSAITEHFDLAVAASHGHTLYQLDAPLIIVPHGMGYNKFLETGNRKPETGNRFSVCPMSGCYTRAV